jgi:hypothetical protein
MMVNHGAGATKKSAQKKISLLAVALLEANAKCGTLDSSRNSPWLTCGDSFALDPCRPGLFSDLFETLAPARSIRLGSFV